MTRRFDPTPIPTAVLEELLATALRAPSAGFSQGIDLLVLSSESRRAQFWELASEASWREQPSAQHLMVAPTIVVPVADPLAYVERYGETDKARTLLGGRGHQDWPVPFWLIDAAFATMLLLLSATDAGLGALFFQLHGVQDAVLAGLGLPAERELIGAVALGRPAPGDPSTSPAKRARRVPATVIHHEHW